MTRRVVLSLVASAVLLSACAVEPVYFVVDFGDIAESYFYPPSDFVVPSPGGRLLDLPLSLDSSYPPGSSFDVISPEDYFSDIDLGCPYIPYSSDPAYSSPIPSGPPSGGGGSPSGGDGEGGFDPVGSWGVLSSFMSGLFSAIVGLFLVASVLCLSFLLFRMFKYSSNRV